jgi:hypothetical protein
MLPVLVTTSQKHLWALRPFAYLFNTYWSSLQHVDVITDVKPGFTLPDNFEVISTTGGRPSPKERWSDMLILAMRNHVHSSHFVLLLEDYWMIRTVDVGGVASLADYARQHADVLRMDLTSDRQFNGRARDAGAWGHYDLVETHADSEYQMSLQAGIWNRDHMLSILRAGMTPWEIELYLTPALAERPDLKVVGTKQCPVRYANVSNSGKGLVEDEVRRVPAEHLERMRREGWVKTPSFKEVIGVGS